MKELLLLLHNFFSSANAKMRVRRIEKSNENKKNISYYEPSDIEGFIERDSGVGSYLISGNNRVNRLRATTSVAVSSLSLGVPVVVLHEGNRDLENMLQSATTFSSVRHIISSNSNTYDPFYNRFDVEIYNLILNSKGDSVLMNAVASEYIKGISKFIQSKNIPPFFDMFLRCPHDTLFDKVEEARLNGHIDDNTALSIRNSLMQGQGERPGVQSFFSQLSYQGTGVLSNKNTRASVTNVKDVVSKGGIISIDIGSSSNDILINLIVNEIKERINSGAKVMLIVDRITLGANNLLLNLVKSQSQGCLTTLTSDDVYAMAGSDDNLFHSLAGNACKCIVFNHGSGVSCKKWSEVFGYYEEDKVSKNIGGMGSFFPIYGFNPQYTYSVSENSEFIIKPDEINRLSSNEVYILDKVSQELIYSKLI